MQVGKKTKKSQQIYLGVKGPRVSRGFFETTTDAGTVVSWSEKTFLGCLLGRELWRTFPLKVAAQGAIAGTPTGGILNAPLGAM